MRGLWIAGSLMAGLGLAGCGDGAEQQPAGIAMGGSGASLPGAIAGAPGNVAAPAPGGIGGGAAPAGTAGSAMLPMAGSPPVPVPDAGALPQDAAIASNDASASADAGPDPGSDSCDRACLIAVAHGFLGALVKHDASSLKLATTLKYTENGSAQEVGEGLWKNASKLHEDTRVEYADPQEGQVGTQIVLDENSSSPVMYQMRLKVVAHEITEIESMSVRQADAANGFFSVAGMMPEALWSQPVDAAKRLTRAQLKAEVDLYIDYLDGKTNSSGVHLDSGCARYENGVQTASGISFALQNWAFDVVPRYLVFDEEYGIAWGMFPFAMTANSLVVGEAFKVVDSKIMMIRAVMANMPAKAWD